MIYLLQKCKTYIY